LILFRWIVGFPEDDLGRPVEMGPVATGMEVLIRDLPLVLGRQPDGPGHGHFSPPVIAWLLEGLDTEAAHVVDPGVRFQVGAIEFLVGVRIPPLALVQDDGWRAPVEVQGYFAATVNLAILVQRMENDVTRHGSCSWIGPTPAGRAGNKSRHARRAGDKVASLAVPDASL
jgi:hypothetical protein